MIKNSRLAIFASGSGTNAEQIFRYFSGHASIHSVLLVSNNPDAYALTRAADHHIPTAVFNRSEFNDGTVLKELESHHVTHVILAGFLWLVPENILKAFSGRIINIHPALLPDFGGKGMYGMKVHQAVKAAGLGKTGITIHEVNENYDEGRIIFQASCEISPSDEPENIARKVHALEYQYFPSVIESWILDVPLKATH